MTAVTVNETQIKAILTAVTVNEIQFKPNMTTAYLFHCSIMWNDQCQACQA